MSCTESDSNSGSSGIIERYEASLKESDRPALPSLKRRVEAVDPNGGRCLIENVPAHCIVELMHCFPKRKAGRARLMTSLEWHWNMPRGSLNLDTRYNVFPVRPHLRRLYEWPKGWGSWLLVPETRIVDLYYATVVLDRPFWKTSRESFPMIENGVFLYRFIPLDWDTKMTDLVITRQDVQPQHTPPLPARYTLHTHPFNTLPEVKSHVHPKFAILEIGRKLKALPSRDLVFSLIKKHPVLECALAIYGAWTMPCPNRRFARIAPNLGNETDDKSDSGTNDSAKHTPPPYPPRRSNKRRRTPSNSLPSSPRKKQRQSSSDFGRKLQEHTETVGKRKWDPASVGEWVGHCQPLEHHEPWKAADD